MSATRIYIVDERPAVRLALVDRLSHAPNIQVIGHTGDAEEVLAKVAEGRPDVVLVEVKRSDGMGLEIIRQVTSMEGAPRALVLTSYASDWEHEAARRAGASGYVLKDIDSEELIRQIMDLAHKS
ncbi:MAG: response regulator transcription factor [Chloroflexota bacterium]